MRQKEFTLSKRNPVVILSLLSAVFALTGLVFLLISWSGRIIPASTVFTRMAETSISLLWAVYVFFFAKKEKCRFLIPLTFVVNLLINLLFLYTNIRNIIRYSQYGYFVDLNIIVNLLVQLVMVSVCVMASADYFKKYETKTFTVIAVICVCAERSYYILSDLYNLIRYYDMYVFSAATISFYLRTAATVITYISLLVYVLKYKKQNFVLTER